MCTIGHSHIYIELARTIYIRYIYGNFGRKTIKYTVIYGVYMVLANSMYTRCIYVIFGQGHHQICVHIRCIYTVHIRYFWAGTSPNMRPCTLHIHGVYTLFLGRDITKYASIYVAYTRLRPTLPMRLCACVTHHLLLAHSMTWHPPLDWRWERADWKATTPLLWYWSRWQTSSGSSKLR